MTGWDWTFVGEQAFSIALGISVGGWIVIGRLRAVAFELLSNKAVRQLASAADKISGKSGGMLGQLIEGLGKL